MSQQPSSVPENPVQPSGAPPKVVLPKKTAERVNQSAKNMVWAMLATLAVLLPVLMLNARQKMTFEPNVDVPALARDAQGAADFPLANPDLPEGWKANYARWTVGADKVNSWEVGYITPGRQFIGLTQSGNANETWINQKVGQSPVTGERQVGQTAWQLRDDAKKDVNGRTTKSLVSDEGGMTYLLQGTADLAEFDVLAKTLKP